MSSGQLHGILAEYPTPGALRKAARVVKAAGYKHWDCYSPFPVHGIDPDMGIRMTRLPLIVFAAGCIGLCAGLLLQWWANAFDWPWIVSGKPLWSIPASIPIAFETTILLSAFAAFFGMWILNNLPAPYHPVFESDRFRKATSHGFFIALEANDDKFTVDEAQTLLKEAGASHIETIYIPDDPEGRKLPKPLVAFMIFSGVAAIVPIAYIAKARHSRSPEPRIHLVPDMDFQPKFKAQQHTNLFKDGRSVRIAPAGTVARGELQADDAFYRGIDGEAWVTTFPRQVSVDAETLERGQERFGVYCSPCHGLSGYGDGMITRRAEAIGSPKWVIPSSLHLEYVVRMPHGQLFNVITNGARSMRGYAAQVSPDDRWAVVMYIRALQRSQAAKLDDVPSNQRNTLR